MAAEPSDHHPLDTELRARLRALDPKQSELAKRMGRLNKYIHGAGHATVDDVIRMVAVLIGVDGLTDRERRLLRGFRRLKETAPQDDVLNYLERVVLRRKGPSAPAAQTRRGATHKAPGKP